MFPFLSVWTNSSTHSRVVGDVVILEDHVFQNTMWSTVFHSIIYMYFVGFHSVCALDDPLEAIKPHPIWNMYVENSRRENLYVLNPPPLPANKWSNYLLMNFTQLKVMYTVMGNITVMILLSQWCMLNFISQDGCLYNFESYCLGKSYYTQSIFNSSSQFIMVCRGC